MRKVIAILILVGLAALLYFNPSIYQRNGGDDMMKLADANIEEDEILPLAKADDGVLTFSVTSLQETPDDIVTFNAMLMKVMYNYDERKKEGTSDEDIELLAKVQRQYYHPDLLEINPEGMHFLGIVSEVKKAREGLSWIVDYQVDSPVYANDNPDVAVVKVTFIPNSLGNSTDIIQQFLLEREEGLWYIKGWIGLDADETTIIE